MALDTKKWLKSLGFDDAKVEELAPQFDPKAGEIDKQLLMRGDYDRFSGENNTLRDQLKAKDDQINKEMAEWAELKNKDGEQATELRARLETAQNERNLLETRLRSFAEEQGLDPDKVIPKLGEQKPPEKKVDGPDPMAGIQSALGGWADYMLTLSSELPMIAAEHLELTGEKLDTRAFVAGIKADFQAKKLDNVDPVKRWEAQYAIPAKRAEKDKTARAAEISEAETRGYTKARSEAAIPGQNAPGHSAPIFTTLRPEGSGPKLSRTGNQPGTNTRQFAASLGSHKYRQPAGSGKT